MQLDQPQGGGTPWALGQVQVTGQGRLAAPTSSTLPDVDSVLWFHFSVLILRLTTCLRQNRDRASVWGLTAPLPTGLWRYF